MTMEGWVVITILTVSILGFFRLQKLWGSHRISNDTQMIIEPHRQTYVCAITGKISTEAVKLELGLVKKESRS